MRGSTKPRLPKSDKDVRGELTSRIKQCYALAEHHQAQADKYRDEARQIEDVLR